MINAAYFRRHAQTCIQLARATKDERVAAKLIEMAEDFTARAAELEKNGRNRSRGFSRA